MALLNFSIVRKRLMPSLCMLISYGLVNPAYSSTASLEDAVNQAGKQRMITQRLLKDYAMVGMALEYGDPSSDLKKMITQFDQALIGLKAMDVNDEVSQSLNEVDDLWRPIQLILEKTPEQNKAPSLQKDLEKLLQACHESTVLISKASGSKAGEIVNIAGRQRMLSQRLASLYMLKVWGIDDPEFEAKLEKAMAEFSQAQQTLESSPLSTPEITDKLAKVKRSYSWFQMMGRSKSGKYTPSLISKSADNMLTQMNEVTQLYVVGK